MEKICLSQGPVPVTAIFQVQMRRDLDHQMCRDLELQIQRDLGILELQMSRDLKLQMCRDLVQFQICRILVKSSKF